MRHLPLEADSEFPARVATGLIFNLILQYFIFTAGKWKGAWMAFCLMCQKDLANFRNYASWFGETGGSSCFSTSSRKMPLAAVILCLSSCLCLELEQAFLILLGETANWPGVFWEGFQVLFFPVAKVQTKQYIYYVIGSLAPWSDNKRLVALAWVCFALRFAKIICFLSLVIRE